MTNPSNDPAGGPAGAQREDKGAADLRSGSSAPRSDSPAAQSPGAGNRPDHTNHSGDCCEPKSPTRTAGEPSREPTRNPTGSRGSLADLPKPSQHLGVRETKGDDNRASQDARADTEGTPGPGRAPDRETSQPGKPDRVSPQDPRRPGRDEPVQPERPSPTQPSRVSEPVIGAADMTGTGDTES